MRKAGLLDKKPLTATRSMLDTARKDTGTKKKEGIFNPGYIEYESRYYFRAALSADKEILEIDLFTRKDLAAKRREPRFRIFLDYKREDFISWDIVNEKWRSAKIDMLETDDDRYRYSYRGKNHATKDTLDTVNSYLHTGRMKDVEMAVLDFQARVRKIELSRKHKLVTDAIDSYMNMVPDRLPADWMRFINDRVLQHSIFYTKDTKTGYCTHCRLHVPVPQDIKHNMSGKCRQCGSSVTYKSWKMQLHTTYCTTAAILQRCTDGEHYVCRQFMVYMNTERDSYYEPEILIHEDQRSLFILDDVHGMMGSMKNYEWGEFRHTGIDRWCVDGTVNHGGYLCDNFGYAHSVLYTGNLKRLLRIGGSPLEYIPVAEIVKGMGRERINVVTMLEDMTNGRFPYEAFWKMGLRNFVQDHIRHGGRPGLTEMGCPSAGVPKPWDHIGLTKEAMRQAVRLDATDQQMRILQKAAAAGVRLTDGQVGWFDRYMGVDAILEYLNMQTPQRIIRYLREETGVEENGSGRSNELLHLWTDYLETARQLDWDLRDRSVFFPQKIRRAHDEAAVIFTAREDEIRAEEMRAKDRIMCQNAAEIRRAFCYSDDMYTIRVPECYLDLVHEGHAQHNCVATYYDRAIEGRCIILFIRKVQAPEESFCTVEIINSDGRFKIMQNRIAYNKAAPEDARAFMDRVVKEAQKIADRMAAEGGRRIRQKVAG